MPPVRKAELNGLSEPLLQRLEPMIAARMI
jgi:hypothetical protein